MIEATWIWAVLGIVLIAVEILAIGTLYILWFGIAAIFLAIVTWLLPNIPYAIQLIAFAILSIGSLATWRRYYKKTDSNSAVGQSQGEEIGRIGTVTQTTSPAQSGLIRFTQGLMGSREWVAVSDEVIEANSQAKVTAVEGNTLRITKIN
ncbi:NfeD family protein [Methylotenera sp.]|uniref:NfeD family protein n=1 Tax=Methylotenera sp. TaxID=2051956 RepID=UPI002EDB640E